MAKPVGPYSPIVRTGDWLISSGQVGIDDGVLADGFAAQVEQVFNNLRSVLATEGAALTDVVKATVFLTDMGNYGEFNEIYTANFDGHRPARSCVEVAGLPVGAEVEIEVVARVDQG